MGLLTAKRVQQLGAQITIAGRSEKKLQVAAETLGGDVNVTSLDTTDDMRVQQWAANLGKVDHLIITASSAAHGMFAEVPIQAIRDMFAVDR